MAVRKTKKTGASKKRKSPLSTGKKKMSAPTRLIATLIVAALFIGLLYSLARIDVNDVGVDTYTHENSPSKKAAHHSDGPGLKTTNNNDYSFYSLLKDFEVKIPSSGRQTDIEQQTSRYLIQAGSFKTENQAEQQRAELILLGLAPTVEKTTNSRGEQWFRVRLGPYDSRSEMAHARDTLVSNRFDAMVMKRNRSSN